MEQTNSQPSTVQLESLMDNPKVLISHLYAIGAFGGAVADMLTILANHNLDSFYEEVAFYLPKKKTIPMDLPTKKKGYGMLERSPLFAVEG